MSKTDTWMVHGALAEYAPTLNGPWFPCVIDSEPWMLGGHTEVVRLRDLPQAYVEYTSRDRRTVPCAATSHVRKMFAK
jgi:hypothetical protein